MVTSLFGDFFKDLRLARELTLRAYCEGANEDPAYISRLERGILKPPQDREVLKRLAKSLGLKKADDLWDEFHRRADVGAGKIPREIMANEELVKHLPLFFRTIENKRFPDEKLEEFVEYIRNIYEEGGEK